MLIEEKDNPRKLVLFWISSEEASDPVFMQTVNNQTANWKNTPYTPIILESGHCSLESSLSMLLKHNYDIANDDEPKGA